MRHDPPKMPVQMTMDRCIKCNICQAHCPVVAVTDTFPGPKYSGPQAERFRDIEAGPEYSPLLCNGCGICTSVCPNDVAIADIITLAKADAVEGGRKLSLGQRLLNRPELLGKLAGIAPFLSNAMLGNRLLRILAEKMLGIDRDAALPNISGRAFNRWFVQRNQPDGQEIAYFQGCATEYYDPQVGMDTVTLLNALGLRVTLPSNLCCSLPMLSSGEMNSARAKAQALVSDLLPVAQAKSTIISTSTSCSMTLRSKYEVYLGMTDANTKLVGAAIVDLCEFLRENHLAQLRTKMKPMPMKVLYHGPCQLRNHQIGQPAVTLMRLIPEIDLHLSQAECCGIGGTYGYDVKKSAIAKAIGTTLTEQAARLKPDVIICDSETCRWNIGKNTGIETIHPAQFLLRAL
jgi:glycerol-3-phosphate dehydrogenase subunit C